MYCVNESFFFVRVADETRRIVLPLTDLLGGGPSRDHGGSPWLEKSRSLRYEIVNLIMEALSSWEVMAAGSGSIFASS